MDERRYGTNHYCAGCPRSNTLHLASDCHVNRAQTSKELALQGLKRVHTWNGKTRIIEIDRHLNLARTFALGMLGTVGKSHLHLAEKLINISLNVRDGCLLKNFKKSV